MTRPSIERRVVTGAELRAKTSDSAPKLAGYAALFNTASDDLGGFTEVIMPGAFRGAIPKSDIRALFNHDPNFVMGRNKAGTLTVAEDNRGLSMEVTPPDVQWVRDLLVSVERGDIDQMSFGFRVAKGGDEWLYTDDAVTRTITEIEELFDVAVVTYPAYPDTDVAVRSLDAWKVAHQTVADPPKAVQRDLRRRRLALLGI
jgi:uncharacterized protein